MPLNGNWDFGLDPNNSGIKEGWFETVLPSKVRLPGSIDEQGLSIKATEPVMTRLTRTYAYVGPAWYMKQVVIPAEWSGKRIELFLEHCHWESQVWVDGKYAGMQNSLSIPHTYELGAMLTPGEHKIAIRIDNTMKIDIGGWSHTLAEETQTDWNGIIGRIELRSTEAVWIRSVDVYPDFDTRVMRARVNIGNNTTSEISGKLNLEITPPDNGQKNILVKTADFKSGTGQTWVDVNLPFDDKLKQWDEFSPSLYRLKASLNLNGKTGPDAVKEMTFGLRDLRKDGDHFRMNGRKVFLRGNLENCIFPLTGYPPMDVNNWLRICRIAKSYGLNHLRFHSWCPPEAAFAAADQTGIMLQIELPHWIVWVIGNIGSNTDRTTFLTEEADRILETYGNHPSFCFLSMGNELGVSRDTFLESLVDHCKQKDSRRFYCSSTGISGPNFGDDYLIRQSLDKGPIRGMGRPGNIPSTDFDFCNLLADVNVPIITHEVGQWLMYLNFAEIKKYTGHLKPLNYEAFRKSLAQHNMLEQAEEFRVATGKFIVELYKEEIESILRTSNSAGFQLLGIQDYPGHGAALIGILDAFWDSKGLIKPEDFRHFCGPTVPLLRFEKRVWTTAETFTASVEVCHYDQSEIKNAVLQWLISDSNGKAIARGNFNSLNIAAGGVAKIGKFSFDLSKIQTAQKLTVSVSIKGTDILNTWNIWVYSADVNASIPADIVVSAAWDKKTQDALERGEKVLLLAPKGRFKNSVTASFYPPFWSLPLFPSQAITMGITCKPEHASLAEFPTDSHSDWQWFDLLNSSEGISLDETPADFQPIVQFIAECSHNNKLGALFEAKVAKGRLMVTSLDLQNNLNAQPVARQLLHSIVAYMESDNFKPSKEFGIDVLSKIFAPAISDEEISTINANAVVLNVKASANMTLMAASVPWQPGFDRALTKAEGFDYSVRGESWHDNQGNCWYGSKLAVEVLCPKGFEGTLYANLSDWDNQNRISVVELDSKESGRLSGMGAKGKWISVPVSAGDSADGKIILGATAASGPNAMVTQIILVCNK